MPKNKKPLLAILLLLFLGFLLRALLTPLINKGDILVHYEWSKRLYEEGLKGSYFYEGWIYSFPTQPPLMMLLFWLSQWLYEHRYFLALIHNVVRFPPASLIIWLAENGEIFFTKFWAILADLLSSLLVYLLLLRITKKQKLAILGLAAFLFNPISIFISSIWGQNGILAAFLAVLSFFVFRFKWGLFFSPLLLSAGVLIKPTALVLVPFYLIFLAREFLNCPKNKRKLFLFFFIGGSLLSFLITLWLFLPFWDASQELLPYIESIIQRRIVISAKGVSRASISAFNFYSMIFVIDKTLGNYRLFFLTLDQIGTIVISLITIFAAFLWWQRNPRSFSSRVIWLSLCFYLVAEGAFIFKTSMVERYFLPAFLPTIILFFLTKKRFQIVFLFQNLVWFVNLYFSFFLRDSDFLNAIFIENNYLGVRLFSLFNVLIYVFIIFSLAKVFQKKEIRYLELFKDHS